MIKDKQISIGILGFGYMGEAIFRLLKKSSKNYYFYIHSKNLNKLIGAEIVPSIEELFNKSNYVFLAIKPQDFKKITQQSFNHNKIFISLMAGVKIKSIKKTFPYNRVIRIMPNIALSVGKSFTGWSCNQKDFTVKELRSIRKILNYFGTELFLQDETEIDKITAISGSGPAYVFLFLNSLVEATKKLGFDNKTSEYLVIRMVEGSIKFYQSNTQSLEFLIDKISSKGGTTESAFKIINKNKFEQLWEKAIISAYQRAMEISK